MKKVLCLLLALMFALTITGCGIEIADENGPDDTSLATITEENIINMDLGASSYSMSPSSEDENYMNSLTKFKGSEFSGVAEIYYTNFLGKSDVIVNLENIVVNSGNFKVVVLLNDEIVHEFNNEDMAQSFRMDDIKGYYSVRIVGESADFKAYMNIQ